MEFKIIIASSIVFISACSSAPDLSKPRGAFIPANPKEFSYALKAKKNENEEVNKITLAENKSNGNKKIGLIENKNNQAEIKNKSLPNEKKSEIKMPFILPKEKEIAKSNQQSIKPPVKAIPNQVISQPLIKAPPVVAQTWEIGQGMTLKDGVVSWAAKERCTIPGLAHWSVVWNTSTNYRIDAPLRFNGTFKEALQSVFSLYISAEKPLFVSTKTPQCLIFISDKN